MNKFIIILIGLLLGIQANGQETIKRIVGAVVDENDNPLPGVWVTMPGIQTIIKTYTDGTGRFDLNLKEPIILGTSNIITLKFEIDGYFYKPKNACIINPKTSVLNADVILVKKPKNTITVCIKDKYTKANVENCKIKYDGKVQTTDEFGNAFILTNPDDNDYMERTLQVIKKGFYQDFDTSFTLSLVRSKGNFMTIYLKGNGATSPPPERECEKNKTGDFCFINKSDVSLKIRFYTGDFNQSVYTPNEMQQYDVEPGDSANIFDLKERSYKYYATYEGNPYGGFDSQFGTKEGTVKVLRCRTNRYTFKFKR